MGLAIIRVASFAAVLSSIATAALARPAVRHGRAPRRLAAYAVATGRPIHLAVCPSRRADPRCALTFKNTAARRLCQHLGRGRHDWYYVVGPTPERRPAVAICL